MKHSKWVSKDVIIQDLDRPTKTHTALNDICTYCRTPKNEWDLISRFPDIPVSGEWEPLALLISLGFIKKKSRKYQWNTRLGLPGNYPAITEVK